MAGAIEVELDDSLHLLLQFPGLLCANKSRVIGIIKALILDGPSKLNFITDFDRTLTKYRVVSSSTGLNKNGWSSFEAFQDGNVLPEGYRIETNRLRDLYYPIELDPSTPVVEKLPHMTEWWIREINLFHQYGLKKTDISSIVKLCDVRLREDCGQLLNLLNDMAIPVLVLSAGVKESIEELLRQQASLHENVRIVANRLNFDENGLCLPGVQGDLIHVFNKAELSAEISQEIIVQLQRFNAIVVGDMVADIEITRIHEGLLGRVLKIGFLNVNTEGHLLSYLENFDIVLTEDPGCGFLIQLVKLLKPVL